MGYDRQKVIDIALKEVGYLEKKTNAQLDDMTANAGSNNYTKYARDLYAAGYYNGNKNGYAWCDVFVDWCFFKAFGKTVGQAIQCQTGDLGAGCVYSARYYQNKGQLHTSNPQVGDQIFFGTSASDVTHTGLVYKVDGSKVYTVEGNTSGASGVIANGGGVCKKSYALSYAKIYGYGRPAYGDGYSGAAAPSGAASGNAAPAPGPFAVGDMVKFTGGKHYTNSSAILPKSCKGGKAKVTAVALGKAHPYHLVRVEGGGSTVCGWVDAAYIEPLASDTWVPAVGDTVIYNGTKHYTSSNAATAKNCKGGKAKITAYANGAKHPYHLIRVSGSGATVYGWVDAGTIKKA